MIARKGRLFFRAGKDDIPPLLEYLQTEIEWDPQRVAVAGCSNGGTGAFTLAADNPGVFKAVVAIPGSLGVKADKLQGVSVYLRAGEKDSASWLKSVTAAKQALTKAGCRVDFEILPKQGHIPKIPSKEIFTWLHTALTPVQAE